MSRRYGRSVDREVRKRRVVRWIVALAVAVVVGFLLLGRAREAFAPDPVAAFVAVQPAGSDVATVGRVEIAAGTAFDLHAVVEAEDRDGRKFYYTTAPKLRLDGREIPASELGPWRGGGVTRVLWFTVEAFPPYGELASGNDGRNLEYKAVFQPDWPLTWSVPGSVQPSVENYLPDRDQARRGVRFGTQRFQVRVEIRGAQDEILPRQALESWPPAQVAEKGDHFPGVVSVLPGRLAEPSAVFGLPQREPAATGSQETLRLLTGWQTERLAFSRVTLLRAWLDSTAVAWEDLAWRTADLASAAEAGGPGDLLRAGERLVWVLEDRGRQGVLEYDDLCLDFERGARVLTLGEVFTGSGLVERAAVEQEEGQR